MTPTLPDSLARLVEAYLDALAPLRPRVLGVYAHGSLALDAFEERASDIDAIVFTDGSLPSDDVARLSEIHRRLHRTHPLAARLDVAYVPFGDLGRNAAAVAPHPVARDGRFRPAGRGDLNAVTWWLLKHHGLALLGPPTTALPIAVAWEDVRRAMRDNLDGYWAAKAARPYLFVSDFWVEFAVTTLCRILSTLEDGEIVAKTVALDLWRGRLPERWRPLVDEARRLRHDPAAPSRYRSRLGRARAALAFVAFARERGRAGPPKTGSWRS